MCARQYSAATLAQGNQFTGYNPIGASGTDPGFRSYVAGLRTNGATVYGVTDATSPNNIGSFNPGEQLPISTGVQASGTYAPGSGLSVATGIDISAAEGERVDTVDYPGYVDSGPLNASGIAHSYKYNTVITRPLLTVDGTPGGTQNQNSYKNV